jgi:hypothetical protein
MNEDFTNKISSAQQALFMQSRTEGITSEIGTLDQLKTPRSFALYEEYIRCDIDETIRARKNNYKSSSLERRKELENEVEVEVCAFRKWLEDTKKLESSISHYYALSIKSLLIGLPTGVPTAQLFSIVLERISASQNHNTP